MIEDVKWLKPGDYFGRNKGMHTCWVAKSGKVSKGYFYKYAVAGNFLQIGKDSRLEYVDPDGVCDRSYLDKKPVLR